MVEFEIAAFAGDLAVEAAVVEVEHVAEAVELEIEPVEFAAVVVG